ncbi:MAG: glutathione S-transferase N-terminal domain-containing protein [Candidatus Pelagadaptatus aseana]|uniref:glutathione S-transferase N-terminal domain-containing protein n=1 Tax=Candidatus Pelagadaptatus aseana TaxID=3120508 RepID=UPI0039B29BFE
MQPVLDVLNSSVTSTMRAWRGTSAKPARRQPKQMLELYEFESCPYCRLVREALTELDVDAMIYPCPPGGDRYRKQVRELGGRVQLPFLVDHNTGKKLYESDAIIQYLYKTYGQRRQPLGLRELAVAGSISASLVRGKQTARPARQPEKPLVLYSFESSPFARRVRERLCELELPYELRNTGKAMWRDMGPPQIRSALFPGLAVKGRNRKALLERTGKVQVPYLIDPNTGVEMYESADINRYLEHTYGQKNKK